MALTAETKNWIIGATGFSKVCEAYIAHGIKDPYFSFPTFYFNLSYLFELSLKSYLSFKGYEDQSIKNNFGHNLERLWNKATAEGYIPPSELVRDLLEVLTPLHTNHNLRYLPDDWLKVPEDHVQSMRVAKSHLLAIGHQIGLPEDI